MRQRLAAERHERRRGCLAVNQKKSQGGERLNRTPREEEALITHL